MAKEEFSDGFDGLANDLERYLDGSEKAIEALVVGAKELVDDLKKLTKPYSKITKPTYTHLVDSVTFRRSDKDVLVGWSKYYGPMLEHGTVKMLPQPMIKPVYERNKEKYYQLMLKTLGL